MAAAMQSVNRQDVGQNNEKKMTNSSPHAFIPAPQVRGGGPRLWIFIFFAKVLHPSDTSLQICANLPPDQESGARLRIENFR
jgi:hypothetical protein